MQNGEFPQKSPTDMKTAHLLLLMLAFATARGQSFIDVIAEREFPSGSSQYALYEAKKNSGLFESATPVRIGDFWAHQENGRHKSLILNGESPPNKH